METSPSLTMRSVNHFDDSFDELWLSIEKRRTVAVTKNAEYLNWRYVECPVRPYGQIAAYHGDTLQGLAVFSIDKGRHDAYLLELLARDDDPETMRYLALHVLRKLKANDMGLVAASFPENSKATAVLKELGFKSWATRFWNMDLTIATDTRKERCPELELKNWDFSLGDWLYH